MECEICGRETTTVYEVTVDGAKMLACERCSKGKGIPISTGGGEGARRRDAMTAVPVIREKETEEFVENFGDVIKRAREKNGLPIKVLAEMINEKESNLVRIEKGKSFPGEKTRLKLEKELRIKLLVKTTEKREQIPGSGKAEPVTLWDMIKKKVGGEGE
jgi:putative transcription factor